MKLRELLPGARRRRRRAPRPDGPRTIVEPRRALDRPADRFDAARDRLRAQIPPREDDDAAPDSP